MSFVLAKQQLQWDQKTLEEMKFEIVGNMDGAKKALTEDTADIFLWEKFTTKHLVDEGIFKRIGEVYTPWPCFVMAVNEETYLAKKPQFEKMLNIVQQECLKFKENKGNTSVEYVVENHKNTPEDAEAWLQTAAWSCETLFEEDMLKNVAETLVSVGVLKEEQIVDLDFVKDVLVSGGKAQLLSKTCSINDASSSISGESSPDHGLKSESISDSASTAESTISDSGTSSAPTKAGLASKSSKNEFAAKMPQVEVAGA